MAHRYFNEDHHMSPERKVHVTIMDGDHPVHIPVVNGVLSIPDPLHDRFVAGPGWVKYTGQVPASVENLQPIESVDAFYNPKKK